MAVERYTHIPMKIATGKAVPMEVEPIKVIPGADGYSPTVSVEDITGGHRVTITDKDGEHVFDVMDGEQGPAGQPGADGAPGAKGDPGVGVPEGGTAGQVLQKASDTDYDTEWATPSGGDVTDVQVNGTSVVTDGVANVPILTKNGQTAIPYVSGNRGLIVLTESGVPSLGINGANVNAVKGGVTYWSVLIPQVQHAAAFYGLAKAAGADMASVSGATVGVYPEAQKSAISQMLNGSIAITGSTPAIDALPGVRYVCGEVATLDITTPASGIIDVIFESGSTPTVLTVTPPTGMTMKWANGFDPALLEANAVYEVNVMDGVYGVGASWT